MKKFSNEELQAILDDYYENDAEMASQEVQQARDCCHDALDEYIAAVSGDMFLKGFRHALKLIGEGGAEA